jgi:phosphopantetheinyl transferase
MAKSVVAAYLGQANMAKIEIESGVFNQPLVKYVGWDIPGVSLSHSDEWSVALSFPSGHPMALDIERLDAQKLKVIESQMTKYEIDSLNESGIDKSKGYCQIWTMKEALSKVLGCGLTTPFSVFEIANPHFQKSGNSQCHFKNFGQYKCHSWIINGYALSIVLPKKTEINLDVHVFFS